MSVTDGELPVEPEARFEPPKTSEPPASINLNALLDHLTTSGRTRALAAGGGNDEVQRRLDNVSRLANELRAELAALSALAPPDEKPVS